MDGAIDFPNTYPLNSEVYLVDSAAVQLLNNWGLVVTFPRLTQPVTPYTIYPRLRYTANSMLVLCFSCFIGEVKPTKTIAEECDIMINALEKVKSIAQKDEDHLNMEKTSILTLPSFKLFVIRFFCFCFLLFYVFILVTIFYLKLRSDFSGTIKLFLQKLVQQQPRYS